MLTQEELHSGYIAEIVIDKINEQVRNVDYFGYFIVYEMR
jgi:hypothetical protein